MVITRERIGRFRRVTTYFKLPRADASCGCGFESIRYWNFKLVIYQWQICEKSIFFSLIVSKQGRPEHPRLADVDATNREQIG